MATLQEAEAQLAAWEATSLAVANAQSSTSENGRSVDLPDADTVRQMIDYWGAKVAALKAAASPNGRNRGGASIASFFSPALRR